MDSVKDKVVIKVTSTSELFFFFHQIQNISPHAVRHARTNPTKRRRNIPLKL